MENLLSHTLCNHKERPTTTINSPKILAIAPSRQTFQTPSFVPPIHQAFCNNQDHVRLHDHRGHGPRTSGITDRVLDNIVQSSLPGPSSPCSNTMLAEMITVVIVNNPKTTSVIKKNFTYKSYRCHEFKNLSPQKITTATDMHFLSVSPSPSLLLSFSPSLLLSFSLFSFLFSLFSFSFSFLLLLLLLSSPSLFLSFLSTPIEPQNEVVQG